MQNCAGHIQLSCFLQWECKTEMDEDYQFGRIQVLCEGFNSPNDPYVLRGSCGVENNHLLCRGVAYCISPAAGI